MKKANNIIELIENLDSEINQEINKDWYVPIYREQLDRIRKELYFTNSNKTFFIAGQSGNGKTTALSFFVNTEIKKKFKPVYISSADFVDIYDINIADILYGLVIHLIKISNNSKLFLEEIDTLKKIYDGSIKEEQLKQVEKKYSAKANIEASAGFKFWTFLGFKSSIVNSFAFDKNAKKIIREKISAKITDFLKILNDIIAELQKDKSILLIIDDMEKLRNLKQIRELFIKERNIFDRINGVKIITIPGHLPNDPQFRTNTNFFYFGKIIKKNPITDKSNKNIEKNKEELKSIILKRINKNINIIEINALEKALNYSAGMPNILIKIIRTAAIIALDENFITQIDIDSAIDEIKLNYLPSLVENSSITDILFSILSKNRPKIKEEEENNIFEEAILANQIIVYYDDTIWYDINPTIKDKVKFYSQLNK